MCAFEWVWHVVRHSFAGVVQRTAHAEFLERWAMAGRPGAFHKKHGTNIRLYEEGIVAHRVDSYNKAVVFTEQPIPIGASFQVKMLDKGGGWAGSIVSFLGEFRALVVNRGAIFTRNRGKCMYSHS